MTVNKIKSQNSFKSNFELVDSHNILDDEFMDLPELDDAMLENAIVKKAGRPISNNPRKSISLRLPQDVIDDWKATGKAWQSRMVEKLSEIKKAS
jgi:uncharacterized protein (DUF4415 family)